LVKILTGVYPPTSGEIFRDGREVRFHSPTDARRNGVVAVYQDTEIISQFTVAQNVLLGSELTVGASGLVRDRAGVKLAQDILDRNGIHIEATRPASSLGPGERQLLALAKVMHANRRVIFLDEPSAALTAEEVKQLFAVIERVKRSGVSVIYISHRLEEIVVICDRVTVLKDGRVAGTLAGTDIKTEQVVEMMIGHGIAPSRGAAARTPLPDAPILEVRDLETRRIKALSFSARKGEIVGFTGVIGSGAEDIAGALFGVLPVKSGSIVLNGAAVVPSSPLQMQRLGVGFIPADRKAEAALPDLSVQANLTAGILQQLSAAGFVVPDRERAVATQMIELLDVRPPDGRRKLKLLSGGNQQKVVVGRWIAAKSAVYLINEPTAGVDVGAIEEIHGVLRRIADQGATIVLYSSVIHELLELCDMIYVMRDGRVTYETAAAGASHDQILSRSMGGLVTQI
jgi:ABC-type sugar transport system ATPase subunit